MSLVGTANELGVSAGKLGKPFDASSTVLTRSRCGVFAAVDVPYDYPSQKGPQSSLRADFNRDLPSLAARLIIDREILIEAVTLPEDPEEALIRHQLHSANKTYIATYCARLDSPLDFTPTAYAERVEKQYRYVCVTRGPYLSSTLKEQLMMSLLERLLRMLDEGNPVRGWARRHAKATLGEV